MSATTVLLIDHDEDTRQICTSILAYLGYRVLTAGHAEEGVALARAEGPAVVILELTLPGRDGWEVITELRQDQNTARIPVVVLTARVLETERVRAHDVGCAAWLPKPCSPRTLAQEIERLLGPELPAEPMAG